MEKGGRKTKIKINEKQKHSCEKGYNIKKYKKIRKFNEPPSERNLTNFTSMKKVKREKL